MLLPDILKVVGALAGWGSNSWLWQKVPLIEKYF
jgi:hypothetical protein